ncbi:MAG: hypothetical protein ABI647_23220 [Gemmatimonadota bacterium]
MTARSSRLVGWGVGAGFLAALASPVTAQTSLTIYNDGRVLHRRTFPLRVPAGYSEHRLSLGLLDPGSLFALDSTVTVTATRYDAAIDEASAMRRSIGRSITFSSLNQTGTRTETTADVLGVDPERFRLGDGRIVYERLGTPLFPVDVVLADPSVLVGVRAPAARTALTLGFFTAGASWRADYTVVLGKTTARVSGMAAVTVGKLQADSAEVQLVAGDVGRAAPKAQQMVAMRAQSFEADQAAGQQSIGEVHLYTLPGPISLTPGIETAALLFEPATVGYERAYTVRGVIPYWGGLPQFGDETTEPVRVSYTLKRPLKTEFGDRPLPAGTMRLYQRDAEGRAQLVGEANVGHTAAGQAVRVDAGTAFDLTAKRVQKSYATRRDSTRTIATAEYTVTISNAKDTAATVDVIEARGGEWTVLSSSVPAEKLSSTETRFRIRVPAKGETTLTYRIRVIW